MQVKGICHGGAAHFTEKACHVDFFTLCSQGDDAPMEARHQRLGPVSD